MVLHHFVWEGSRVILTAADETSCWCPLSYFRKTFARHDPCAAVPSRLPMRVCVRRQRTVIGQIELSTLAGFCSRRDSGTLVFPQPPLCMMQSLSPLPPFSPPRGRWSYQIELPGLPPDSTKLYPSLLPFPQIIPLPPSASLLFLFMSARASFCSCWLQQTLIGYAIATNVER